ncbi:MAG: divalent-cation tolerance protein CutA [Chloroflexi bacterium]|nr:divalent-cation tolerance protein CutA [Chloroflexota bacterium]
MILAYVVCANIDEAKKISRHLLEQRVAACTNMFPIQSAYWWEGKIVEDAEAVLIAKTIDANFEKVKQAVLQLHSYSVPAIFSIPVGHVEEKYSKWLCGEVQ